MGLGISVWSPWLTAAAGDEGDTLTIARLLVYPLELTPVLIRFASGLLDGRGA